MPILLTDYEPRATCPNCGADISTAYDLCDRCAAQRDASNEEEEAA
jgi:predicted amidophosphoribosyltransferase